MGAVKARFPDALHGFTTLTGLGPPKIAFSDDLCMACEMFFHCEFALIFELPPHHQPKRICLGSPLSSSKLLQG